MATSPIWKAAGDTIGELHGTVGPHLGYFEGDREDVLDWLELLHPDFRERLDKNNGTKLMLIEPRVVVPPDIVELREAMQNKTAADERLETALKAGTEEE